MSTSKKPPRVPPLVDLSPEDVRKLPRPHKGFDVFATRLVALYKANPDVLPTDGIDLDKLLEEVAAYQALEEPEYEAAKQLERLQNTRIIHAANAWVAMLELYVRAVAMGRTNAVIKAGIADFVQFMKHTRKHTPKTKTPPATPTT